MKVAQAIDHIHFQALPCDDLNRKMLRRPTFEQDEKEVEDAVDHSDAHTGKDSDDLPTLHKDP